MQPITVLIVDDSALIRKLLADMLAGAPGIEVVGTAINAQHAREEIKRLNPHVLTLDVEMPGMDGIAFLEKIMALRPMPVIMISSFTERGADITLRALEAGAVDYMRKPGAIYGDALKFGQVREELAEKIRIAAAANIVRPPKASKPILKLGSSATSEVIAIGSSTGGVEALREIFSVLPSDCPPIAMTQHMPATFTPSLAARLNALSEMQVSEAAHGVMLKRGHAYLAPGNRHLKIIRKASHFYCHLEDSAPVSGHCPSVDVLFDSVAEAAGPDAVGVILTGMGKDGAAGLLSMHSRGAPTIGQDESSCVVYGMPRAAMALGAVDTELPLSAIAEQMLAAGARQGRKQHASRI